MSFDTDLYCLMRDRVDILAPTASTSLYGIETYTAVSTGLPARIVGATIRRRDMRGPVEAAGDVLWVATTIDVTTGNVIRVGTDVRQVREIEAYPDETGAHHLKIMLGRIT